LSRFRAKAHGKTLILNVIYNARAILRWRRKRKRGR